MLSLLVLSSTVRGMRERGRDTQRKWMNCGQETLHSFAPIKFAGRVFDESRNSYSFYSYTTPTAAVAICGPAPFPTHSSSLLFHAIYAARLLGHAPSSSLVSGSLATCHTVCQGVLSHRQQWPRLDDHYRYPRNMISVDKESCFPAACHWSERVGLSKRQLPGPALPHMVMRSCCREGPKIGNFLSSASL